MLLLAQALFAVLFTIFPHMPLSHRRCLRSHEVDVTGAAAQAAETTGVPVAVILAVGFLESHLGCDPASGGSWGSPINRGHRLVAGSPLRAAEDLATSFRVCRKVSWEAAVSRFRCGLCRCRLPMVQNGYTPAYTMQLVRRMETQAHE